MMERCRRRYGDMFTLRGRARGHLGVPGRPRRGASRCSPATRACCTPAEANVVGAPVARPQLRAASSTSCRTWRSASSTLLLVPRRADARATGRSMHRGHRAGGGGLARAAGPCRLLAAHAGDHARGDHAHRLRRDRRPRALAAVGARRCAEVLVAGRSDPRRWPCSRVIGPAAGCRALRACSGGAIEPADELLFAEIRRAPRSPRTSRSATTCSRCSSQARDEDGRADVATRSCATS